MIDEDPEFIQKAFWDWIEEEAKENEVTIDYYIEEFLV